MQHWSRRGFLGAAAGAAAFGAEAETLAALDARALYEGLEAWRVLPQGDQLVWDGRNTKAGAKGFVVKLKMQGLPLKNVPS